MIFYTERAPQYGRQKSIIKISTQSFQVLNDTLVSPEHTAVEISLENKVLTERLTGFHVDLGSKVWSEWNISWLTQFNFGIVVTEQIIALCVTNKLEICRSRTKHAGYNNCYLIVMSRTITRLSSNVMTHYGLAKPFLLLNHPAIMKIAIHAINA